MPIAPFLTQSATEQGFTNANVSASSPTRATVNVPQARAGVLFGWIAQMETRGLEIESLVARANADQTVAVDVVFKARGS